MGNVLSFWSRSPRIAAVKLVAQVGGLLSIVALVGQGAAPPTHYPIIQLPAFACASTGLIVALLAFGTCDQKLDKSAWDWLGKEPAQAHAAEIERKEAFLRRPLNAHSSGAHITAGCFVMGCIASGVRAPVASSLFAFVLNSLGLASYCYWGSCRLTAWRADHIFMEAHVLCLAVLFAALSFPEHEIPVVALSAVFMSVRAYYICPPSRRAQLGFAGIVAYVAALGGMFFTGDPGYWRRFVSGLGITILGFFPKVLDACNGYVCGTALFHFTSALGFVCFFLWAQTLPDRRSQ